MRRLASPLILALLLATAVPARALEPPLSVNAYAVQRPDAREASLVVGVFADRPALVSVHVALPAGWSGASDWTGVVSGTQLLVFSLHTDGPPGLGTIVVSATDDRGNRAGDHAWVRAPGEVAPAAQRPSRTWLALVRR